MKLTSFRDQTYELKRLYWEPTSLMFIEGNEIFNEVLEMNSTRYPFNLKQAPLQLNITPSDFPRHSTWLYFEGPPRDKQHTHSVLILLVYTDEPILNFKLLTKIKSIDFEDNICDYNI